MSPALVNFFAAEFRILAKKVDLLERRYAVHPAAEVNIVTFELIDAPASHSEVRHPQSIQLAQLLPSELFERPVDSAGLGPTTPMRAPSLVLL